MGACRLVFFVVSRRYSAAPSGRLRADHAHIDQTPASVVDEPLQHFAEHVEIHLVVPIDQLAVAAQLHRIGIAAALVEDRHLAGELRGRNRETDRRGAFR